MFLLVLAGVASRAPAQERPSLRTIRSTQFTGVDKDNVRAWVDRQMQALFAADNPIRAGQQLFFDPEDGLVIHYRAGNATQAFREGLAEVVATSFVSAYGNGKEGGTPAATYPLMALKVFGERSAVPAYQAALRDDSPAIRTLAVQGLLTVRDAFGTQQWPNVVQLIRNAAEVETNDVALGEMYRFLMTDDGQRVGTSLTAMLAILDARQQRFTNTSTLPSTADARAIRWIAGRWNAINADNLRTRIVERTASLLTHAVHDYLIMLPETQQLLIRLEDDIERINQTFTAITALPAAELGLTNDDTAQQAADKIEQTFSRLDTVYGSSTPRRIDLERTIRDVEKALTSMVDTNSPPSIRTPMLSAKGDAKVTGMITELNKWVGDGGTDGLLNAAPYNLPKHLNISRTVPSP